MILDSIIAPYGRTVVRLLKSPVESTDTSAWEDILNYQSEIQKYLSQIGLELIVKRDEGFAYIKQIVDDEGKTTGLIPRQQLGFEVSVILIILRQMLEEFDSNIDELYATERFVSADELKERIEMFLPERFNRVKLLNEIDTYINRIVGFGYLKLVKRDNVNTYQIHRIIKEKVTLDKLVEFKTKLQEFMADENGESENADEYKDEIHDADDPMKSIDIQKTSSAQVIDEINNLNQKEDVESV